MLFNCAHLVEVFICLGLLRTMENHTNLRTPKDQVVSNTEGFVSPGAKQAQWQCCGGRCEADKHGVWRLKQVGWGLGIRMFRLCWSIGFHMRIKWTCTVHLWQHAEKRWFPSARITTDEATSRFQWSVLFLYWMQSCKFWTPHGESSTISCFI